MTRKRERTLSADGHLAKKKVGSANNVLGLYAQLKAAMETATLSEQTLKLKALNEELLAAKTSGTLMIAVEGILEQERKNKAIEGPMVGLGGFITTSVVNQTPVPVECWCLLLIWLQTLTHLTEEKFTAEYTKDLIQNAGVAIQRDLGRSKSVSSACYILHLLKTIIVLVPSVAAGMLRQIPIDKYSLQKWLRNREEVVIECLSDLPTSPRREYLMWIASAMQASGQSLRILLGKQNTFVTVVEGIAADSARDAVEFLTSVKSAMLSTGRESVQLLRSFASTEVCCALIDSLAAAEDVAQAENGITSGPVIHEIIGLTSLLLSSVHYVENVEDPPSNDRHVNVVLLNLVKHIAGKHLRSDRSFEILLSIVHHVPSICLPFCQQFQLTFDTSQPEVCLLRLVRCQKVVGALLSSPMDEHFVTRVLPFGITRPVLLRLLQSKNLAVRLASLLLLHSIASQFMRQIASIDAHSKRKGLDGIRAGNRKRISLVSSFKAKVFNWPELSGFCKNPKSIVDVEWTFVLNIATIGIQMDADHADDIRSIIAPTLQYLQPALKGEDRIVLAGALQRSLYTTLSEMGIEFLRSKRKALCAIVTEDLLNPAIDQMVVLALKQFMVVWWTAEGQRGFEMVQFCDRTLLEAKRSNFNESELREKIKSVFLNPGNADICGDCDNYTSHDISAFTRIYEYEAHIGSSDVLKTADLLSVARAAKAVGENERLQSVVYHTVRKMQSEISSKNVVTILSELLNNAQSGESNTNLRLACTTAISILSKAELNLVNTLEPTLKLIFDLILNSTDEQNLLGIVGLARCGLANASAAELLSILPHTCKLALTEQLNKCSLFHRASRPDSEIAVKISFNAAQFTHCCNCQLNSGDMERHIVGQFSDNGGGFSIFPVCVNEIWKLLENITNLVSEINESSETPAMLASKCDILFTLLQVDAIVEDGEVLASMRTILLALGKHVSESIDNLTSPLGSKFILLLLKNYGGTWQAQDCLCSEALFAVEMGIYKLPTATQGVSLVALSKRLLEAKREEEDLEGDTAAQSLITLADILMQNAPNDIMKMFDVRHLSASWKAQYTAEGHYNADFTLLVLSFIIDDPSAMDLKLFFVRPWFSCLMTLLTVSSRDMRQAAYDLLALLHERVAGDKALKEGKQIGNLLESMRRTITVPLMRLPMFLTTWYAEIATILCQPLHPLYPFAGHAINARAYFDPSDIPMGHEALNSGDSDAGPVLERFILDIITVATNEADLAMIAKHHYLELALANVLSQAQQTNGLDQLLDYVERCIAGVGQAFVFDFVRQGGLQLLMAALSEIGKLKHRRVGLVASAVLAIAGNRKLLHTNHEQIRALCAKIEAVVVQESGLLEAQDPSALLSIMNLLTRENCHSTADAVQSLHAALIAIGYDSAVALEENVKRLVLFPGIVHRLLGELQSVQPCLLAATFLLRWLSSSIRRASSAPVDDMNTCGAVLNVLLTHLQEKQSLDQIKAHMVVAEVLATRELRDDSPCRTMIETHLSSYFQVNG
eukprot:Clim_evm2s164 gene=Clim_evmTU2s164